MERWLPVVGYEGLYEVSSLGRVRGLDRETRTKGGATRKWKGRLLKMRPDRLGYMKVGLWRGGRMKHVKVATVVCTAFHGPRPPGLVVTHLDGSRDNDTPRNLAWRTQSQNMKDKARHGTVPVGEARNNSKLTEKDVRRIRSLEGVVGCRELGRQYGVVHETIRAIWSRRSWAHL